jgi:Major Facilitator Superfamily
MSRPVRALAARAIGYYAVRDFIPLYAVYSLLFADHGLSAGAISSLLVIWSVTGFVFEVPSGAWADTVSRRGLLILSSVLYAVGIAVWTAVPSYPGFAAGFVLWGISSSLMSGTFEAIVYDELAANRSTSSYAGLMGWANSLAMVANLVGTVLAGPLFDVGGYQLMGWVSVGVALLQAVFALSLPPAPRVAEADETNVAPRIHGDRGFVARYLVMLRAGLNEVIRERTIRHAALIASLMMGFLVFDEYFGLIAREDGAPTGTVPYLIGLTVAGQAIGTALAGRTSRISGRAMAVALGVAAVLLAAGVAYGDWAGFAAIGIGYGITNNAIIAAEARLQEAISGRARATVTSVTGFISENFALVVYATFALGSVWFTITALTIALTAMLGGVALLVPRWLPSPPLSIADPEVTVQPRVGR